MIWELRIQIERTFETIVSQFLETTDSMGVAMDVDGAIATLTGYFSQECQQHELEIQLRLALAAHNAENGRCSFTWKLLPDCDWGEAWKADYHPLPIGQRLLVVPSWLDPPPENQRLIIRMDPEMAFGSGTHATTRGCLELLEEISQQQPLGDLLDMGTGSGILAIWAALLGAHSVTATDLDPIATETASRNCHLNGVGDRVKVIETDAVPQGCFQTIVANILALVLIDLAPRLTSTLAPGGSLVLSGILHDQAQSVHNAFAKQGLELLQKRKIDEWSLLVLQSPPSSSTL